jgi:CRP/FNR family transcriptional regulator, cyclic AMP receptor protein
MSLQTSGLHASNIFELPKAYSSMLLGSGKSLPLAEGETLFRKGDPGDGCYWLQQGVLKVTVASEVGEERILAIIGPQSLVGELAVIDDLPRSATVEALRDCHLIFISRSVFEDTLHRHPEIYRHVVSALGSRLRQADEELAAATFLTVKSRVARALLKLAEHLGVKAGPGQVVIDHGFGQADIAAMAGVARESVTRTLGDWRRSGVVGNSARSTYAINIEKLAREAAPD